jgi:hypothetical protein
MKKIFLALLLLCSNSFAAITDGKFGINQIFDVQYWWNGNTLNASSFIAPYDKNWNHPTLSTGQYFKFFASTVSPGEWGLGIYNSNGTLASVVHDYGTIDALGNGAIFYIGSGFFGNVISTSQGYNYGASATFTNMNTNPTTSDFNSYTWASSTPLSAGQTAAPAGPPPPNWQVIRTNSNPVVISNIYPTSYNSPGNEGAANAFDGNASTKYLNFDKKNAGVTVRLSQGRVVQKFTITTANDFSGRDPTSYKLYGSNDGVNWVLIKQDSLTLSDSRFWTSPEIQTGNTAAYVYYFMLFPTTKAGQGCGLNCDSMQIGDITYYYDSNDGVTSTDQAAGTTPSNPGQPGSVCSDCMSSEITATQLATLNAARTRRDAIGLGNRIDLYSGGNGNSVTIEQVGSYNRIQGIGGGNANVSGFGTSVNIKQGDTLSGRNLIELYVQGNGNNVSIDQARNTNTGARDGAESGGHVTMLSVTGDINTMVLRQGNDGGTSSGHFMQVGVQGNFNNGTVKQSNDGEKRAFISVTGNNDVFNVQQSGTGLHYLDLTLTGNGNNANITQKDSGNHKATINLINAGGASNATLVQQGSTAQVYSITQQCATLSGCSVSVTQGQ